jgi:PleD family two-component response regulator
MTHAPPPSAKGPPDHPMPTVLNLDAEAKADIRILVVDDERTLRESCRTFLESEGFSVEVCAKGEEARRSQAWNYSVCVWSAIRKRLRSS